MSRPWMPLYIGDYLGATSHLTTEEHGAYMLLIIHHWQHERLPDNDEVLARITRLPIRRWLKIRSVIKSFFSEGWVHDRVERELEKAREKSDRLSKAGQKGGRPRKPEITKGFSGDDENKASLKSKSFQNGFQNEKPLKSLSKATHYHKESSPSQEVESLQVVESTYPPATARPFHVVGGAG